MSLIINNHYLVSPRHEGYDIALKCPDCGYHCEHLEIGTDDIWPEELKAFMDIKSGRVKMVTWQTVEEFLASMEPPIPGDINPDWLDEPDVGEEDGE
jgi:hypothetical protein